MLEKQSNQSRGGKRAGAGRKKGEPNKRTVETQAAAAQGQTPLEYMLSVMRGSADPRMRMAAAQAAAPYVHAKLSSIEMNAKVVHRTLAEELAELNASHPNADSD